MFTKEGINKNGFLIPALHFNNSRIKICLLLKLYHTSNSKLLPESGNKFLVILYWSGSTETGSSTMQSSLKTS